MSPSDIERQLRESAPPAPDALRDRVRTIVARERAPRRAFRFTPRRASLALVGAVVVAGGGAAVVAGLVSSGSEKRAVPPSSDEVFMRPQSGTSTNVTGGLEEGRLKRLPSHGGVAAAVPKLQESTPDLSVAQLAQPLPTQSADVAPTPLPPAGLRLQDYDVSLGVRVADSAALSKATVAAIRWTRTFGGFVARVSYDTPGSNKRGEADLVLRVPVSKVQDAMRRFSSLGTLTSQHVSIQDLQGRVNAQTKRIITLNRRIGAILKELDGSLTVDRQARLQAELAARKQELAAVTSQKRATVTQGRLAHVYLTLTTKAKHTQGTAVPHKPGRIERRLDDAWRVLAQELAVLLYGLVVVAPFALLAAAGLAAARVQRRRTDRRVLARS
jgi:uncharacterized protein DUF4349